MCIRDRPRVPVPRRSERRRTRGHIRSVSRRLRGETLRPLHGSRVARHDGRAARGVLDGFGEPRLDGSASRGEVEPLLVGRRVRGPGAHVRAQPVAGRLLGLPLGQLSEPVRGPRALLQGWRSQPPHHGPGARGCRVDPRGVGSDDGAILISAGTTSLNVVGQTSTPNPGGAGTFGQSVPALASADLVTSGSQRTIVAVSDDASFRTNLILANATSSPVTVSLALLDASGASLGSQTVPLLSLEMTQILEVARKLSRGSNVTNATLVLTTATSGGAFAAYASTVDNGTNDPRTLLAR